MNVLVILDYFEYFIPFSNQTGRIKYFYVTACRKFLAKNIPNLSFCDLRNYYKLNNQVPKGDWRNYFKVTSVLGSVGYRVNFEGISAYIENYFENYIRENEIKILISGGTTGFERCGIATAKRMRIKTYCVWEGFFRPNTISIDPDGMNAESSFCRKSFDEIIKHKPSEKFINFYEKYLHFLKNKGIDNRNLKNIQGLRFNIFHQIKNRWKDRKDFERIRLPFIQHIGARLSYYFFRNRYLRTDEISNPFIFFPLQTHTDSNIIINGEIFPFEKYVELILNAFLEVKNEIKCQLIIKEHPFDVFRKKYNRKVSKDILWLRPETSIPDVLKNQFSIGTIVINSTSGLESLILGKPVIALAKSVFSLKELTLIPDELKIMNVSRLLVQLRNQRVNADLIFQFAAYLFDTIQFEGDLNNYPSLEEIKDFETNYCQLN